MLWSTVLEDCKGLIKGCSQEQTLPPKLTWSYAMGINICMFEF